MFRDIYNEVKSRLEARDILRDLQQTTSSADEWHKIESVNEYLAKTAKALATIPDAFGVDWFTMHDTNEPMSCGPITGIGE